MSHVVEGKVRLIGETGSLITDITCDQLVGAPRDERTTVCCDEHETFGLYAPDHQQPEMTLLAILGPRGVLELEIVGDSAAAMLGIPLGEKVYVKW